MTKGSINLQDLRRRIWVKAKADTSHKFWGIFVHVCKRETLEAAYKLAKRNGGASGSDGVTFEDIEQQGKEQFLAELQNQLETKKYTPLPVRETKIPKDGKGEFRTLKIPAIRDRVVQGALKLVLEPIFEADFKDGSFGYRPKRSPHQALERVDKALSRGLHKVINLDLAKYFDTVRHHILLGKIAKRVDDADIMWLCKTVLKSSGKKGLPQGSLIGPLMSNIYLNEVDKMLEKAQEVTRDGKFDVVLYVRFADDLAVFVSKYERRIHWVGKVEKRLREEFSKLDLKVNEEKSSIIHFDKEQAVKFLGYEFRLVQQMKDASKKMVLKRPQKKKRTRFLQEVSRVLRKSLHIPVEEMVKTILNPKLRGWVNYFNWGNSAYDLSFVRNEVETKVRRFASRQRPKRKGGRSWTTWSHEEIYGKWGLHSDYHTRRRRVPSS